MSTAEDLAPPHDAEDTAAPARRSGLRPTTLVAIIAAVAVLGSVTYMILSTIRSGAALEYYLNVDQALDDAPRLAGRVVRLHGSVVSGTIQKKPGALDYRFAIFHGERWVEVTYQGLLPDSFKDCAEVVVTGRLAASAPAVPFTASKLTAKCPSKYEEQKAQQAGGCGERFKSLVVAARQGS